MLTRLRENNILQEISLVGKRKNNTKTWHYFFKFHHEYFIT